MYCGLGIRPELFNDVLAQKPTLGFIEAHSENYFGESLARAKLLELREHYAVSLHGVGLSLGRADDLDRAHLAELKSLVNEIQPMLVSEHLSWSAYSHRHIPDLLPLPLTQEAMAIMCAHVDQMQQALGRQILVENPSNYLVFDQLQIPEPDFLNTLAERTGCGLLLDVNNVYVSATNIQRDPLDYLNALETKHVAQYHLAGYTEVEREHSDQRERLLIDTHNHTVYQPVWELFEHTIRTHGTRPTLFEWDSDFPEFSVLLQECEKANQRLQGADTAPTSPATKLALSDADFQQVTLPALAQSQQNFLDDVLELSDQHPLVQAEQKHRIWVYQNNFFGAMQEYLSAVYPATKGVVGEAFFKQMAQVLVQTEPPRFGNIHHYGDKLIDALDRFEGLQSLPYLADLIHYEWALHASYYSAVSDAIDPSAYEQNALLSLPVEFNSSVSLLSSNYPVYQIHRQSLPDFDGEVSISLDQSHDQLLVYKDGFSVETHNLDAEQMQVLLEIRKSENLLQAIEALSGSLEADSLSTSLALVFEAGLLRALPLDE